jgi:5-formyltetrahydrofolate cyclo-ligase
MTQSARATPAAHADKASLRSRALAARAELSDDTRRAAGAAVAAAGAEVVAREKPARVSLFISVKGEIDTAPLADALAALGVSLCLPVIAAKGQPLVFRDWRPGDPLDDRPFGLKEPPPTAAEVEPDLLFVPLAAFDGAGRRVGYGGGFYDRTLEKLRARRATLAVGLAFGAQEVEHVPTEAWDQPLDGLLTEHGYRAVGRAQA